MQNRSQCPKPREPFDVCASLLLALTIQAAIVVLPVCTHSVVFAHKNHFSYAHLHQPGSLQGPAHTEQFLNKQMGSTNTHRMCHHSAAALGTPSNIKHNKTVTVDQCDLLTTMSSSVTRGCRLFTVIFVPSRGLKAG